jgi:hypothetical protein
MWYLDEETSDYYFVGALDWRVTVIHQIPVRKGTFPKLFYLINDNTFKAVPLITVGGLYTALDMAEEIIRYREGFA